MQIKFLGSTETVTGSKHLLLGKNKNIMIDCGLYQGPEADKLNEKIAEQVLAEKIDAIILTHAHLDHCGYLPKLYQLGFRGKIFSTSPTKKLANIVMSDNAKINQKKTKTHNKHITKQKHLKSPFYDQADVNQVLKLFETYDYHERFKFSDFEIQLLPAGHILGACSPLIVENDISIQFSGDLGRKSDLIMYPPHKCESQHYVVLESTYGDRSQKSDFPINEFKHLISQAKKKSSPILIPAFSIGRAQMMMALLFDFFNKNPELEIPVYVDSPMTIEVTKLYYEFENHHKLSSTLLNQIEHRFHFVQYKSQKEKLDALESAHIIISAAGMLSGGPILHHLEKKAQNPHSKLLIVGYQSEGTLGHQILHGNKQVVSADATFQVESEVYELPYFSAHADHDELIAWLRDSAPHTIFLTHGEDSAKNQLKDDLRTSGAYEVLIPKAGENYSLTKK